MGWETPRFCSATCVSTSKARETEHLGSSHGSGVTYAITRMYLTTLIHRMCRRLLWLRRELAASDGLPRCSQRKILIGIQKKNASQ